MQEPTSPASPAIKLGVIADQTGPLSFIGIAGAFGALFSTAGAAALILDPRSSDGTDARSGKLWRLIPALAAAFAGLHIYKLLGSSDHYFNLGLPDYTFEASALFTETKR
mgnify:CR=1 FL=1